QLEENIHTFENEKPLDPKEMETILGIADSMVNGVPCTSCHYCTSHCPQGIDIPSMLKLYNEHSFTGGGFIAPMALMAVPEDKQPSACVGCRSCEAVCPQQIKISEVLEDFSGMLKG
ncbi:MAG: 4Fe-4S dicluster domain-containing protein, partial [Lachnospiraceae bacterium]|nr:4Fe-4S dicluster domain-containing protein [Lachnospiraceae bacterium]